MSCKEYVDLHYQEVSARQTKKLKRRAMNKRNGLILNLKTKTFRIIAILLLCMGLLFSTTSCIVFVKKDNGRHKGWYKNSNNPHNHHITNPGKYNGKTRK